MGLTIAVTRNDTAGGRRIREATVTFDSSYPRGGEAFVPGAVGLTKIESVVSKTPNASFVPAYDEAAGKLKLLAKDSPAPVTRALLDADGAAGVGVVIYAHIPTATVDFARETGKTAPVLGWLEFISPTTTDASVLLSNGDILDVFHDAAANTGGIQVYVDEDEAVCSPIQANIATALKSVIVRTRGGNYVLISHDASAAGNGVAIYLDEDAADASKLQFVSPTNVSTTVNVDPEILPTADVSGTSVQLVISGY